MEVDSLIRKYALINATAHSGRPQPKSVLGKLLAEHPELRKDIMEIKSRIELACEEIGRLDQKKQLAELDALGGYEEPRRIEKKGLEELERGRSFVVRFAPNPDGALHLGNARPAVLCDEYAKMYKGRFILRFDDTDPKVKVPEKIFYRWAREDLRWLKIKWHKEVICSKRLNIYYKHAESLVRSGNAYVCLCGEKWKAYRDKGSACPCRHADAKANMKRWKDILSHNYKEGEAVLRIKTDMQAKNPAVRDWPAMRIVDKPMHPLSKRHIWPLYNFASAIDDHVLGVTHIMRGQEHSTNETKQRYLYEHMGWHYPDTITLGRFSLSGMVLSKSQIREGISRHKFTGWDDLRLGTLRALRRRGFQPDALRHIIHDIGVKPSDITVSMENLSAYNRKIIDSTANRYFFIPEPKKIAVIGLRLRSVKLPMHPNFRRGFRRFLLGKYFYIDAKDFKSYKGVEVRLKELCNVKLGEISELTGMEVKPIPKIQWVPEKHISIRVEMPEKHINGYAEGSLARAKAGEIVQFERFGFVRIEKPGRNVATVFCHE